jgi:hypothetical protein
MMVWQDDWIPAFAGMTNDLCATIGKLYFYRP